MSRESALSVLRVDPFRFAAEARSAAGKIAVAKLARLSDLLVADEGLIRWQLAGFSAQSALAMQSGAGGASEPRLELEVSGTLSLRCQRCLEALQWPLAVRSVLHPVRAGEPIADEELEDDEVDAVEVDGELDVFALIEDEILLALPISPRHENCGPSSGMETAAEESPFAVLASLRSSGRAG